MKRLTSFLVSAVMALCMIFTTAIGVNAETKVKSFDFSQMTYAESRGTEYSISGTKVNTNFAGLYDEVKFKLPEVIDMPSCRTVTFNASSSNNISFKLYDVDGNEVYARYNFRGNGDCTFSPELNVKVDCIGIMSMEEFSVSATVNSVSFKMGKLIEDDPISPERNLLTTYGKAFEHIGAGIIAPKILNKTVLDYTKEEHNSVTPGNEMKPDAILGSSAKTVSVDTAKSLGYYIPEGYSESTMPRLDFGTVDKMLKACYDNDMTMRGHTLVWHQQTPDWYFRENYSANGRYVSQAEMNKRMEFYIKTVMNHVYSNEYGSVLYAWDVVNEYLHGDTESNSGWQQIYGKNLRTKAGFVKSAFEYAHETLEELGLTNKVKLFYNDYNTYQEVNEVIGLINFINSDKKICDGIGMQSHLDTTYPSADLYKKALQAFANEGFEIQITEMDATCDSLDVQSKYYYDILSAVMSAKKDGANITALIFWGLNDEDSWRSERRPLLYTDYSHQKPAYESALKAYEDSGYKPIENVLLGDVNGDGNINSLDLAYLKKYVAGINVSINEKNSDINQDGEVDLADYFKLREMM